MESTEVSEPVPPQEPPRKSRKSNLLWTALFIVLGLGLALRYGIEYRRSTVDRGDELAKEVVGLAEEAQRARDTKDLAAARRSLAQAVSLLKEAEQFKSHPVYVSTMIDLAALLLSSRSPAKSEVEEGRTILTEAWEVAKGFDVRTRWRIARDLGLASVLAGDMAEAEKWYVTATELLPEDKVARDRLNTLRSVKNRK